MIHYAHIYKCMHTRKYIYIYIQHININICIQPILEEPLGDVDGLDKQETKSDVVEELNTSFMFPYRFIYIYLYKYNLC